MTITYRKAREEDENELLNLAAKLAASFKVEREAFSHVFQQVMQSEKMEVVVAEMEDGLVGYAYLLHHPAFYANGTISWVEELYVSDEYRGMSVGRQLMDEAERLAVECGSRLIALATRRAGEFYASIGYEESAIYYKKTF